jgi:BlaI family penicillinase repressor
LIEIGAGMVKRKKLTPAEWGIMDAVWELGGAPSVRDVVEHAFSHGEKAYTTVQTIMNTLERKGLLRREKIGLVNFYTPTRTRDDLVKDEMSALVAGIFGGSVPALANSLLSLEGLTLEEVREIKALLDRKEDELRGEES